MIFEAGAGKVVESLMNNCGNLEGNAEINADNEGVACEV